ncbi:hypothetical protein [Streptococcus equinus]|uniref:hypothetical protein n=1 Tax=Streptococcus equinus TaxID=1335 RepID=UPI0008909614|nr:hypothetical protein [Streptococcus equinus]SDQ40485.1 hypothetical protein SAMN05216407_1350 [Streptococcus equinus]
MDKHQVKKGYRFMFLALFIFFLLMALVFGKILSRFGLKLILCGLILALLGLIITGYRYECEKFSNTDDITRLRTLGVSINPHSLAGKVIYVLSITLIIAILLIILLLL